MNTTGRLIALTSFFLFFFGATHFVHAALIDNGDGTVTDTDTGLMWLKESYPPAGGPETPKTWEQAMLWANSLSFAGHSDWRLPSALEINSGVPDLVWNSVNNEWGNLYGIAWANPANVADIAPMSNYPCCSYWTSTEDPADSTRATAFFVSYDNLWLNQFYVKSTQLRYTAVRGAPKPTKASQCSDGYDNDNNGSADYPNDVGCSDAEDDWEFTCTGFVWCRFQRLPVRYWCIKIEDSTICLERIYLIAGVIAIAGVGFWWIRRRRKGS